MNTTLSKILKVLIPLSIGALLIYLVTNKLTSKDILEIKEAFKKTNYFYVALSIVFGLVSHLSRAYRWHFTLEPLGIKPKLYNTFFTVMIGYIANLGIPRSGEIMRCAMLSRYEKAPFTKVVGTVIAERVVDFIILLFFIATIVFIQKDLLLGFLFPNGIGNTINPTKIGLLGLLLLILAISTIWLIKKSQNSFLLKIKAFAIEIFDGIKTVATMKKKWAYLFHTVIIWALYYLMFHITFFSLPETTSVPVEGIVTGFVIGGLSIVATNGGIGAYPLGMQQVLLLYGITANTGYAFGWTIWTAQTLMVIVVGLLAFILLPILNKKTQKHT